MRRTHWAWVGGALAAVPVTVAVVVFLFFHFAPASALEKLEETVSADHDVHTRDAAKLEQALKMLDDIHTWMLNHK